MKKNLSVLLVVSMLLTTFLFAFNAFAVTSELRGDVTFDGKVSADDARLILRHSVHLEEFTEEQKKVADANGDGEITAADARIALRISVGLEGNDDEPTTDPEQPTEPEEPTTENPLNYMGDWYDPARAGLLYDKFGYISTYEDIAEGDIYFVYDQDGYRDNYKKPYSPGNEPVYDLSKCEYCGKNRQPWDGEHYGCYYGYCSRWIRDKICPECGVFVKANTCHTCGE